MSIILVIIIAVSLSMDAFSLSLAYGTLDINKKDRILLSTIVGIYHFFMPLIGMIIGNELIKILLIKPDTIVFIVLSIIGIQMIIESFKSEKKLQKLQIYEMLLFGLAVALDSFSVGLGLKQIYSNVYLSSFLFSLSSFIFTYLGLYLGTKIHDWIGKVSTIIGGIALIIIGIIYLL